MEPGGYSAAPGKVGGVLVGRVWMGCGNWEYICGFDNVIKCIYYIYLLQKDMDVNSRDPLQNIIPFRVKGVEIGRFDSSGNLKIGTTTTTAPTVRLDISGGEARVNSGSATSTALTTTGRIGVNQPSPTVDLDVSGVSRMAALSATSTALTTVGRIGVNTASPTVDLDVTGAARLTASSATNTALTTVGRIGVNTAAPTVDLDVTGASRMAALSATNTALTTVGRIGVNTAAPTVDLDVTGASRMAALSATNTALTTVGRIGVNTASPTVDLDVTGAARMSALSATNTALTTTGRIGVNTASPTVDLDVTGIMRASTGLILGTNTTAMSPDGCSLDINNSIIALSRFTSGGNGMAIGVHRPSGANISFITNETAIPMTLGTAGQERIRITADGKVGIGTNNPTVALEVTGIMRASTGLILGTNTTTMSDWASSLDINNSNDARMRFTCGSNSLTLGMGTAESYIWNETNTRMVFGTSDTYRMVISSGGDIIMGNSPQNHSYFLLNNGGTNYQGTVTLVVKPLTNAIQNRPYYLNESAILFVNTSGGYSIAPVPFGLDIDPGQSNASQPFGGYFVAFFEGAIQCDFVIIASDKRMKKNITEINNDKPLQLLRKIKCSTFEYIDKIKNTTYTVHGFIAQDIKDVVPESVHTVKDFLPNFYCNCIVEKDRVDEDSKKQIYRVFIPENPIKQLLFTGNHDIYGTEYKTTTGMPASDALGNQNFVVKLYDSSNNEINVETIKIIDEYSFLISVDLNEKGENDKITEKMYFLYGQQVDDFHKIDNDHIHNIATAALQEIDRQQQADKARIAELENQVSNLEATVGSLESTVSSQQSLINDILERLKKLEA